MQTSKNAIIALGVVGALALAACGGSDSASESDDPCAGTSDLAAAFEAGDSAESPEDALDAIGSLADALDDFAASAPDEVRADAEALAEATRTLSEVDPNGELTDEQAELMASDDLDAAGDRIEEYLDENCDIQI